MSNLKGIAAKAEEVTAFAVVAVVKFNPLKKYVSFCETTVPCRIHTN